MTLALLLLSLFAIAALGIPLVFALLGASMFTLWIMRPELPLTLVAQLFVSGIDSYSLLAIALFFLAGEIMSLGGAIDRILAFAKSLVGHMRGGLGQVGVVSSLAMSGVSGSAVADAAAIGPVLIRSMRDEGYPAPLAASIIASGATLGPIIPPSILMIVYAVLANASIGALFLAGVVPGLLLALGLSLVVAVIARRIDLPRSTRASLEQVVKTTLNSLLALLAPFIIVVGIRGGVFTATEAGAIASIYILAISVFFFREIGLRALFECCLRAAQGTGVVMVIVGASSVFAWVIADQQVGVQIAQVITAADLGYWVIFLLLNIVLLAAGAFLDPIAAMAIFVPVLLPVALAVGVDPVHFGVIMTVNLTIGLCTPPVGILLFLTAMMAKTSTLKVIAQITPFIIVMLLTLLAVTYLPELSLWLPNVLRGV